MRPTIRQAGFTMVEVMVVIVEGVDKKYWAFIIKPINRWFNKNPVHSTREGASPSRVFCFY